MSAPVGPINIICLRRSLFGRARDGFAIGLGAAVGDAFYAGLAALGLNAVIGLINTYDIALRLGGGLIMMVFAIRIWRSHPHLDREPQTGGVKRGMAASLVLTLTNPGVFVGFLGLYTLAGIGDLGSGGQAAHQDAIALVLGVFLGAALWWGTLVSLGRFLRDKVTDRLLEIINHISAALIAVFAIVAIASVVVPT
nr:LysE family transporter [Kordiimonas marina]